MVLAGLSGRVLDWRLPCRLREKVPRRCVLCSSKARRLKASVSEETDSSCRAADDGFRPALLLGDHGLGDEGLFRLFADVDRGGLPDAGRAGLQPGDLLYDGDDVPFRQVFRRKGFVCRQGDGFYGWLVRKVLLGTGQDHGRHDGGCCGDGAYASPHPRGNHPLRSRRLVQARLEALPHLRGNGFLRSGHEVPHVYVKLVLFHLFSRSLIISCNLSLARWSLERVVASLRPSACAISLWE